MLCVWFTKDRVYSDYHKLEFMVESRNVEGISGIRVTLVNKYVGLGSRRNHKSCN